MTVLTQNGIQFGDKTEQFTANKGGLAGTGQKWNQVSRSAGVWYTNTRSYPIQVCCVGTYNSGSSHTWFYVDGYQIWSHGAQWNGPGAIAGGGSIIVPPGSIYLITMQSQGIAAWWELY